MLYSYFFNMLKVGVPGFTQTPQLLVYNLFLRPLFIHRSLDLRLYLLLPILSHGEENNEHHKEDRGEENRQRTGEYMLALRLLLKPMMILWNLRLSAVYVLRASTPLPISSTILLFIS